MDADVVDLALERLGRIKHKPGYFWRVEHDNPVTFVKVVMYVERPDVITDQPGIGRVGTYHVRPDLTEGEFFQAILGMLITYEEHETREWFKVLDTRPGHGDYVAPFNPHINFSALLDASRDRD